MLLYQSCHCGWRLFLQSDYTIQMNKLKCDRKKRLFLRLLFFCLPFQCLTGSFYLETLSRKTYFNCIIQFFLSIYFYIQSAMSLDAFVTKQRRKCRKKKRFSHCLTNQIIAPWNHYSILWLLRRLNGFSLRRKTTIWWIGLTLLAYWCRNPFKLMTPHKPI